MRKKKGLQTIEIVGIMVLVLIAVLIIATIFGQRILIVGKAGGCEAQKGKCITPTVDLACGKENTPVADKPISISTTDCTDGKICCIPIG